MNRNTIILETKGEVCLRCGKEMQVRSHKEVTKELRKKPFYYRQWYYCINPACKTNVVHKEEFMVWNRKPFPLPEKVPEPVPVEQHRLAQVLEQLGEKPPWED